MPFNPKDFPTTEDIDRIAREDEYYKLYRCESLDPDGTSDRGKFRLKEFFENDKKKAEILDVAYNVAPLIIDTATDFLFGEEVAIEPEGDGQEKIDKIIDRNRLQSKFAQSSALFQVIGHTHFKLYRNEKGEAVIEEIPYDYWFPNWTKVPLGGEPNSFQIVVHMKDSQDATKKYIYVEDWYLEGTAKVAKSLWEDKGGKVGNQVPLDTLGIVSPGTLDGLTAVEDTLLDEIPIVYLDVRKTAKERHAESVLKKVRPLLNELNDRLTQVSIQFLKHLNAKLQIPETAVTRDPKTGKIQRVDLEVILAKEGDPEAKYITNENPLIEQSFVHIEKILRAIAKLTQTPDSLLTEDEKGGVEKAEALKTRMMGFLKKIRIYQSRYEEAIRNMMRIALKIEGGQEIPLVITFDTGLPKDWEYDSMVWSTALSGGLASKETAVGMFQGIEGDELQAELARIKEDERQMVAALVPDNADDDEQP